MTLSQRLHAAGYTHANCCDNTGEHIIFGPNGGIVGYFTAKQAWEHFFPEEVE